MQEEERPDLMRNMDEAWHKVTSEADPVSALEAFTALKRELARWQEKLVSEAITAGATWDDVGAATGTSRQAAWGRFRKLTGETKGESAAMRQEIDSLNRRVAAESKELQERVKSLHDKWRQERRRLQDEIRGLNNQIAQDRRSLQEEIREKTGSMRDEIRALSGKSQAS